MLRKVSNFIGTTTPDPNTHQSRTTIDQEKSTKLAEYGIPTTLEDCFSCEDPCDDDDNEEGGGGGGGRIDEVFGGWKKGLIDTDWDSELLGSANPAPRNLVVSTGKSDWPREHNDDTSTLSHHLVKAIEGSPPPASLIPPPAPQPGKSKFDNGPLYPKGEGALPPGIRQTPLPPSHMNSTKTEPLASAKTTLFSSSIISQSNSHSRESVLVFPDWKVVTEVENSEEGAEEIWRELSGRETSEGEGKERKSWTLPYRAVVLLCSHKRRDKRCHIAAPLLENALLHSLESHSISVDLKGELLSPHHLSDSHPSLESIPIADRDQEVEKRLRGIEAVEDEEGGGEVGIFRINHSGGHRYAGVMIILFPSGTTLYYGRVSPQEIPAVVKETILKGKIVPGLLRGANNVVRGKGEGCLKGKNLLQW